MDASNRTASRFASYDDGDLVALVAEGLPNYPADGNLSVLTDEQIGEMHDALVDSVAALAADPEMDLDAAAEVGDRIEDSPRRGRHSPGRRSCARGRPSRRSSGARRSSGRKRRGPGRRPGPTGRASRTRQRSR